MNLSISFRFWVAAEQKGGHTLVKKVVWQATIWVASVLPDLEEACNATL